MVRTRNIIILAIAIVVVAGCSAAGVFAGKPDWWKSLEGVSNSIAETQVSAVPYPQAEMKDSLERRNLRERLVRFNQPNKVGYVYIMSFGKFVGYYVIKGKVSSTQSQMTNGNQVWDSGSGEQGETVVESIGDDGSFGINEGGEKGVFFFTSNDVLVITVLDWLYSDQPLSIDVPNLLK